MLRFARLATLALLIGPIGSFTGAAFAQDQPEGQSQPQADVFSKIKLCPPTLQKTCFIAYVTEANKVLVLMSSDSASALGGTEVEIVSAPEKQGDAQPLAPLDLAAARGRIILVDGNGGDRIYGARIVQTADELLTALYLSVFFGADQGPPNDEEIDVPPLSPPDGNEGQPQQ